MIKWENERSNKNYCGWCIGSPPSANCNGTCFLKSDSTGSLPLFEIKKDHLAIEKAKAKQRLKDINDELKHFKK